MRTEIQTSLRVAVLILLAGVVVAQGEQVHFTYLWHLEQPIYWPDQKAGGTDRYEYAWDSIQRTDGGAAHPANNLREIFGIDDRVAAYQYRCKDCISAISWAPEAGAQISYSGGLVENVRSLGNAGQLGYSSSWNSSLQQARGWLTNGQSKPRCDIVQFGFHHPLFPLCDENTMRKEIQLYQATYAETWGSSPAMSRGLFPSEMAFSSRMIQILDEEGIDWVIVSGEHMSRACENFPVILGTGGINCDPPNKADQLNPSQDYWYRDHIDRGCSPCTAIPFGYLPHRVQYVNPDSGNVYEVIAVPAAQALGWDNGYGTMGTGAFHTLDEHQDATRPMIVLMAHDGDNAWGGGYSYYLEATPNLVSQAQSEGFHATVIEEYLADHPVPANDIIHVEDGAWVNADGDFGSPAFLNWNWPLVNGSGQIDIPGGWAEDERNWAVITAAQNRVETAEQIAGGARIGKILHPDSSTTSAERAWHYFLGSLNSGYMYYGTALDMEVKPTVACNEAVEHADAVIGDASQDATAPTIWAPQRHPWNPGSQNFGPQYGYTAYDAGGDFWVWTFAYDVSGLSSVTLKYRLDGDGENPLGSTQNETYAGGAEVGAWQSLAMTHRSFPAGNFHNDPGINFFEMPQYIADEYYVEVTGLSEVLVDYYVEAIDTKGNVKKSPIYHVWVGDGQGGPGPGDAVTVTPDPLQAGASATIQYDPEGRILGGVSQVYLHYGYNGWSPTIDPDPAMSWNAEDSVWEITVSLPSFVTALDFVFNDGQGTWDNNSGQDWHISVEGGSAGEWVIDGQLDADATLIAENNGMSLYAGVRGSLLYLACPDGGEGNDHFLFLVQAPGSPRSAPWSKSGTVAGWAAYMGNENDNGWAGWFDTAAASQATSGGGSGWLEGTIDMSSEFGSIPATLYAAVGPWPTASSTTLQYEYQVPASQNDDGNIDVNEFAELNICAITVGGGSSDADLDGDCDVDLDDFAVFEGCVNGPNAVPGCTEADFDDDGDVDLADFAFFQGEWE